jgi:hypothetical protein
MRTVLQEAPVLEDDDTYIEEPLCAATTASVLTVCASKADFPVLLLYTYIESGARVLL